MAKLEKEYLDDLTQYLNSDEDTVENTDEDTVQNPDEIVKGNIRNDEIRSTEQALLYLVVDKSGSMHNNGLENAVVEGLKEVKRTVNGSRESKCIQTAMTFFGYTLDMRPFKYGECIDITYQANEKETHMYDAIVQSCKNMISQYDKLIGESKVKGVMLIFTDGGENGSKEYTLKDVQDALKELKERDIVYLVAANGVDNISELRNDLGVEPIRIENEHQLRRLMRFVSKTSMDR